MADEEDDVVGVCSECRSVQPMHYMEKSVFTTAGKSAPCKYCGGVTIIVERENMEQALQQISRERGITTR
jgi:hypothetical protein